MYRRYLFYFPDERDFDIVFQLPRESGLTFPEKDSLVIEGRAPPDPK